jgi:Flp pilus assembly protein CpaB
MRKTRGVLFILVGLVLAGLAGFAVLSFAKQAEANATARAAASVVAEVQPIPKVMVVVALRDLPENVAISTEDISKKLMPTEFAPADAIAVPEIAVGKYTTSRIFQGEIIVSPLLAVSKQTSQLAARIPQGKVAMAVVVGDAMNSLGAIRAGDRVDVLLSLDLKGLAPLAAPQMDANGATQSSAGLNVPQLSTQLTMQNVEVLAIGVPAGDTPGNATAQASAQSQTQQQQSKTITFLLDRQDAVTLKYIKDSGGTMDLLVRGSTDQELAKTDAVTLDTVYRKFSFHFVEPVSH